MGYAEAPRETDDGADPIAPAAGVVPRPLRILLADDSADNRMLVGAYLKKLPYTIEIAENGAAAIQAVKRVDYDLILMDIQMPVVDGITAARAIRAWERETSRARTPIIALTAAALDEAVQRSRAAGCDAHVAKPVKQATLIAAIEAVAGGAGLAAGAAPATAGEAGENMAEPKRTVVEIDADLSDLAPSFLEHKRADARLLQAAIERGDLAAVAALAHRIKGEGGSYGFDEMTEIGAAMEIAGRARDAAGARREIARLAEYLATVEVIYR